MSRGGAKLHTGGNRRGPVFILLHYGQFLELVGGVIFLGQVDPKLIQTQVCAFSDCLARRLGIKSTNARAVGDGGSFGDSFTAQKPDHFCRHPAHNLAVKLILRTKSYHQYPAGFYLAQGVNQCGLTGPAFDLPIFD